MKRLYSTSRCISIMKRLARIPSLNETLPFKRFIYKYTYTHAREVNEKWRNLCKFDAARCTMYSNRRKYDQWVETSMIFEIADRLQDWIMGIINFENDRKDWCYEIDYINIIRCNKCEHCFIWKDLEIYEFILLSFHINVYCLFVIRESKERSSHLYKHSKLGHRWWAASIYTIVLWIVKQWHWIPLKETYLHRELQTRINESERFLFPR